MQPMDPIRLFRSMMAGMATGLGILFVPELYALGWAPPAGDCPLRWEKGPSEAVESQPPVLWPEQRKGPPF